MAGNSARLAIADKPQGHIVFMVRDQDDSEGFRPVPRGAKICDLPVRMAGSSQKDRKADRGANRYMSLAEFDDDDEGTCPSSPATHAVRGRQSQAASGHSVHQSKTKKPVKIEEDFDDIISEFLSPKGPRTTQAGEIHDRRYGFEVLR